MLHLNVLWQFCNQRIKLSITCLHSTISLQMRALRSFPSKMVFFNPTLPYVPYRILKKKLERRMCIVHWRSLLRIIMAIMDHEWADHAKRIIALSQFWYDADHEQAGSLSLSRIHNCLFSKTIMSIEVFVFLLLTLSIIIFISISLWDQFITFN